MIIIIIITKKKNNIYINNNFENTTGGSLPLTFCISCDLLASIMLLKREPAFFLVLRNGDSGPQGAGEGEESREDAGDPPIRFMNRAGGRRDRGSAALFGKSRSKR
jgi:hypothetical protein